MSSNMATSSKPIKVTTTYDPNELKWVKVAIKRHNIKASATNLPLERSLDNPVSISNFVHLSGSSDGELFRKITPNTVQLPVGAYSKVKPPPDKERAAPQRGSSRARSASVSSDEEIKQEPRPRSKEKFKSSEVASTAKQKRPDLKRERSRSRGPSTGRSAAQPYDSPSRHNRKSTRSGSRSPSPKASHRNSRHRSAEKRYSPARRYSPGGNGRQHSPSNSPHDRYRSSPRRSKSPAAKEHVRNLSTTQGVFVPDKRKRERDSHSPSPSNHRHESSSSRSRRRSRDDSRDRYRHSSRSPPPRDRHRARGDSRDRYRHGSRSPPSRDGHRNSSRERDRHRNSPRSASMERRGDERRAEFGEAPYIPYYDPALIRAPPMPFFPSPMAPFYPTHGFPPFFNRPYFPPESGFIKEAPARPPIVYNNRKIPKFNTQGAAPRAPAANAQRKKAPASNNGTITKLESAAATASCTVTSNGGASQSNMHQPHTNSANNGVA